MSSLPETSLDLVETACCFVGIVIPLVLAETSFAHVETWLDLAVNSWVPVVVVTSWAFVVAEASLADAVTHLLVVATRLGAVAVVAAAAVVAEKPVVAAVVVVPYSDAETHLDLAVVAS